MALAGDPGRIRTPNPQSRNLIFYPIELRSPQIESAKIYILKLNLMKYRSIIVFFELI